MATKDKIIEELLWLSDRISTQVRTLGIGLLAITWGFLIGQPEISGPVPENLKKHLLIVGILVLCAMICDFLQYFFGYLNTKRLLNNIERENMSEITYDYTTLSYRVRNFFFWFKQILLFLSCSWFLAIIIPFCIKVL